MSSVKVTQLPYIPPRKSHDGIHRFVVKYGRLGDDTIRFMCFKRDNAAVKFLNEKIAEGYVARITMK